MWLSPNVCLRATNASTLLSGIWFCNQAGSHLCYQCLDTISAAQKTNWSRTLRDRLADYNTFMCVCVYMCVYHESHCMDRCLQWSWVICLHYTTSVQPPRAIIYSELLKHTHTKRQKAPQTEGETLYLYPHIMGLSGGLEALDSTPKHKKPLLYLQLNSAHIHIQLFIKCSSN